MRRIARHYEASTGIDRAEFEGEALLAIVGKAHRYRGQTTWETWCWLTSKGAATRLIRRESYRRVAPLPPDLAAREAEASEWVVEQLQCLTDREAEALVWTLGLDGSGDRGCGEVAHALGTTLATIKLRKSKALAKLRAKLNSRYRPEFKRVDLREGVRRAAQ